MSKEIPFESITVGETLGPMEYAVVKSDVDQYCEDCDSCLTMKSVHSTFLRGLPDN